MRQNEVNVLMCIQQFLIEVLHIYISRDIVYIYAYVLMEKLGKFEPLMTLVVFVYLNS